MNLAGTVMTTNETKITRISYRSYFCLSFRNKVDVWEAVGWNGEWGGGKYVPVNTENHYALKDSRLHGAYCCSGGNQLGFRRKIL